MITTGIYQITYLFILLLPFERLLVFDLFGFTVKPAYLLALVVVVWLTFSTLLRPVLIMRLKYLISHIELEEYLLFALVSWSFLSSFWSLAPMRSLIYSTLLFLLIILFMIFRRIITSDTRERVLNTIIWMGVAVSVLAIAQFFIEPIFGYKLALLSEQYGSRVFGFPRPQATFIEPLYLANFLLFPIFVKLNKELIFRQAQDPFGRIKNNGQAGNIQYSIFPSENSGSLRDNIRAIKRNLGLILMLVAFLLTLSRGAYLGLVAGFVVIVVVSALVRRFDWRHIARFLIIGAVSIIISLASIYIVAGKNGVNNFYNHATKTTDLDPTNQIEALQNRGLSREIAVQNFALNPIVGTGLASFGALPQFKELRKVGEWQTVNNQYLEIATELGVTGLMIFLATIYLAVSYQLFQSKTYRPLDEAIRNKKYDNVVYLGWLVAVLVQYLTFSSIYLLYLWVFLAIIWPVDSERSA